MDVHQIEYEILQALAIVVGSLALWAIQRVLTWLNIRLTADRQTMLESAVNKVMTLGVTRADAVIREKGWDHIDSKNAVINQALPVLQERFQVALKAAGYDMTNSDDRERITRMMERMWPDVATRVSASPASPPSPVAPVSVTLPPAV